MLCGSFSLLFCAPVTSFTIQKKIINTHAKASRTMWSLIQGSPSLTLMALNHYKRLCSMGYGSLLCNNLKLAYIMQTSKYIIIIIISFILQQKEADKKNSTHCSIKKKMWVRKSIFIAVFKFKISSLDFSFITSTDPAFYILSMTLAFSLEFPYYFCQCTFSVQMSLLDYMCLTLSVLSVRILRAIVSSGILVFPHLIYVALSMASPLCSTFINALPLFRCYFFSDVLCGSFLCHSMLV